MKGFRSFYRVQEWFFRVTGLQVSVLGLRLLGLRGRLGSLDRVLDLLANFRFKGFRIIKELQL